MPRKFPLQTTLTMVDKITTTANRVENKMTGFSKKMQRNFRGINSAANRANKAINRVGKSRVAQAGLAGVAIATGMVVRSFIQFDDSITAAAAKFPDLNLATKKGQESLELMRKTARQVGSDVEFTSTQAAQGFDFMAMAGFTLNQSVALLPGVTNLATVANVDLARATDIASDAIGAFGMMTEDTTQLTKNFTRIQDAMAKTTTSTNTDINDLFESIKKGAPAFTMAGQAMETFDALAGRMAANAIKGSDAGTALKTGILNLAAPTPKAQKAINKMGLSIFDSSGKMRDMIDILFDMEKSFKTMTQKQVLAASKAIFGKNAFSAFGVVLNEGVGQSKELQQTLIGAGGSAAKSADIIRGSLGNRLKIIMSAVEDLGFRILDVFKGDMESGATGAAAAIKKFDVTPIITGLKAFAALLKFTFTVLGPFLPLIIKIAIATKLWIAAQKAMIAVRWGFTILSWINFVIMMRASIIKAIAIQYAQVKATIAQKISLVASKIAMIASTAWTWLMVAATTAWNVAATIATVATWSLGIAIAFLTSPIFLIVAAIVILVAGAYLLIKNWTVVKEFFLGMWQPIKDAFWAAIDWIVKKFTTMIDWVVNKWKSVKKFFGFADESSKLADATRAATINAAATIERGEGSPFTAGPEMFRSPATQRSENVTTNRTAVDVNFNNMPDSAAIDRKGRTAPGTTLNLGVNPT